MRNLRSMTVEDFIKHLQHTNLRLVICFEPHPHPDDYGFMAVLIPEIEVDGRLILDWEEAKTFSLNKLTVLEAIESVMPAYFFPYEEKEMTDASVASE